MQRDNQRPTIVNDYIYIAIILLLLLLLIKQKLRPQNSLGITGAIGHWLKDRRNKKKQEKALKDLGLSKGEAENIFKNTNKYWERRGGISKNILL